MSLSSLVDSTKLWRSKQHVRISSVLKGSLVHAPDGMQDVHTDTKQAEDSEVVKVSTVDPQRVANLSDAVDSATASASGHVTLPASCKQQHSRHRKRRQQQHVRRRAERQRVKVTGKCSDLQRASCVYVKVPAAWAVVWLRVLSKCGAVVVGEEEDTACTAAARLPCFPHDFPATQAYWYGVFIPISPGCALQHKPEFTAWVCLVRTVCNQFCRMQ
jgi:hypothetical protein